MSKYLFSILSGLSTLWVCPLLGYNDKFDYLMLAQHYPTSLCLVDNKSKEGSCAVPRNATPWTVHGLWPSRKDGKIPEECHNPGRKFDIEKVKSIEDKLTIKWPNLFPHQSVYSLWFLSFDSLVKFRIWVDFVQRFKKKALLRMTEMTFEMSEVCLEKHEWEKHGSCAEVLPELGDELKYFQKSLQLHDQFDIFKYLTDGGIHPGKGLSYNIDDITDAIAKQLGNKLVEMRCVHDPQDKSWLLSSVRLCMDKDFNVIDCVKANVGENFPSITTCPAQSDIYYPGYLIQESSHLKDIPNPELDNIR